MAQAKKTGDNASMNPTEHPITEDDIANFLANTPDFFERHAELLATVQLSSGHGTRAISVAPEARVACNIGRSAE